MASEDLLILTEDLLQQFYDLYDKGMDHPPAKVVLENYTHEDPDERKKLLKVLNLELLKKYSRTLDSAVLVGKLKSFYGKYNKTTKADASKLEDLIYKDVKNIKTTFKKNAEAAVQVQDQRKALAELEATINSRMREIYHMDLTQLPTDLDAKQGYSGAPSPTGSAASAGSSRLLGSPKPLQASDIRRRLHSPQQLHEPEREYVLPIACVAILALLMLLFGLFARRLKAWLKGAQSGPNSRY